MNLSQVQVSLRKYLLSRLITAEVRYLGIFLTVIIGSHGAAHGTKILHRQVMVLSTLNLYYQILSLTSMAL